MGRMGTVITPSIYPRPIADNAQSHAHMVSSNTQHDDGVPSMGTWRGILERDGKAPIRKIFKAALLPQMRKASVKVDARPLWWQEPSAERFGGGTASAITGDFILGPTSLHTATRRWA